MPGKTQGVLDKGLGLNDLLLKIGGAFFKDIIMRIVFSALSRSLRRSLAALVPISIPLAMAHAVEEAFPQTSPGKIEIKELPTGLLSESSSEQSYFNSSNSLFQPLFRYISDRNIAMTMMNGRPPESRLAFIGMVPLP